jgi:MFS family permease
MKIQVGKWYFGWNIVAVSTIITLLTMGLRMGIGPFFTPMMNDLDMSRTVLSTIIAVSMIVYGLGMPLAGMISGRFGTRFVLLLGVAIISGSIVWTVSTNSILGFFVSFGVLLSIGLAFTSPVAVTSLIGRWFIRQRGKALFFLATGAMAGIAIITPLSAILISWIGWERTLLFFGLLFIVIVVPSAVFIMREDVPEGADRLLSKTAEDKGLSTNQLSGEEPEFSWREAVKTGPFWKISLGLFACGFSMNLIGSHGVPMLVDHHFDAHTASFGIGLIGGVAIFSTLILGSISDRYPRRNILCWIYVIRGLGFLGLVYAVTSWQLYLIAITGGLVWAGSNALSSALIGDLYGVKLMSLLYGWSYFGHQIGAAIGSFLGGWGYETFGTHVVSFGTATVLLMIAGIVSYRIPKDVSLVHATIIQNRTPQHGA